MGSYYFDFGDFDIHDLHIVGWVLELVLVIALVAIAIGVTCYVFYSLGLYTLAKRRGIPGPGLAWVPIGASWILGSIADDYAKKVTGTESKLRFALLWLSVSGFAVSLFTAVAPALGLLAAPIGLAHIVLMFMALFKVYKSCTVENAVLYLVLSILFPIIIPFVLFALRKRDAFVRVEYGAPQWPPYQGQTPPYGGDGNPTQ